MTAEERIIAHIEKNQAKQRAEQKQKVLEYTAMVNGICPKCEGEDIQRTRYRYECLNCKFYVYKKTAV